MNFSAPNTLHLRNLSQIWTEKYSLKTPKATIAVTSFCALLSMGLIGQIIFVFIVEHDIVMRISTTKENSIGLWTVLIVGIVAVVELLLAMVGFKPNFYQQFKL